MGREQGEAARLLAAAGQALYGEVWQSAMAADLEINPRTLRSWISGKQTPPAPVLQRVLAMLGEARREIVAAEKALDVFCSKGLPVKSATRKM